MKKIEQEVSETAKPPLTFLEEMRAIAHNLGNVLTPISGVIELCDLESKDFRLIDTAKKACERLDELHKTMIKIVQTEKIKVAVQMPDERRLEIATKVLIWIYRQQRTEEFMRTLKTAGANSDVSEDDMFEFFKFIADKMPVKKK